MTLPALIDKQDNVEIVRDELAAILAAESASQQTLASNAGMDPDLWKLRVFLERANPWENLPSKLNDATPVVNIWWDTSTFDMSSSNVVDRQKAAATFNIDCYGYGRSADDPSGGHVAGDLDAVKVAQRAVRLVRNILMAAEYTYLGQRGLVWRRWVDSITMFQPQQDNENVHHIVAARLSFRVEFNEYSPQVPPETLELLSVDVKRTEDNEIVVEADYDYTT